MTSFGKLGFCRHFYVHWHHDVCWGAVVDALQFFVLLCEKCREERGEAWRVRAGEYSLGQDRVSCSRMSLGRHTPPTTKNSSAPPSMSVPCPALLLACTDPFKFSVTQFLSFGHSYNLLPAACECVTLFILITMSATKYLVSAATQYAHRRAGALLLSQPSAPLRPFCFWVYILTATKMLG